MLKVLFVAAEAAPFAKTGGLGDVVGSLPKALRDEGIDARVLIPHYGFIDNNAYNLTFNFAYRLQRTVGNADIYISKTHYKSVPHYFLRSWPFFNEYYHYTDENWDVQRFIFFAQAVTEFIWQIANGADNESGAWWPDVVHVHDWHTALVPFLLHEGRFMEGWNKVASVMSIHNMAYQGRFAGYWLDQVGVAPRRDYFLNLMQRTGDLLAIGLAYADKLNTVSPNHAVELHYPRFGEGLEGLIWARDADFVGILNGLDTDLYNPATARELFHNFDADNFRTERIHNKRGLQELVGLPVSDETPLLGIVSRLVEQKGIDLALPALYRLCADTDMQVVILGTGERSIEHDLWQLANIFHWKVRNMSHFDPILAHRIYAGSDFFLMPSRYEPCGTGQMIALRYGSLPVVRQTGGLVDTVQNYDNADAGVGTGFSFLWEDPEAIVGTLRWAFNTYKFNRPAFERMQERGMRHDWHWKHSAHQYISLYTQALAKKRAWMPEYSQTKA